MKKSTLIVVFGMLILAACTKESDQLELHYSPKTGVASEAPFEVYAPQAEAYVELEEGLLEYLGREATASSCEVTKGIWLWETAMNYWFPSVEFDQANAFVADYDEEIVDERTIEMNLSGGAFETSLLRTEFITTYEDVERRVLDGLDHVVTDVQFVDLQGDVISLKVRSIYYLNPVFAQYSGTPTVPSATIDKMAGYKGACAGGPVALGSWQDAAKNVKASFKKPIPVINGLYYSNIVGFTSKMGSINLKYLDGTYLPGNTSAIFSIHKPLLNPLICLSVSEQNAYTQAMANQFHSIILKRNYWDGIASLSCSSNVPAGGGACFWSYRLNLAKHFTYPEHRAKLMPASVI